MKVLARIMIKKTEFILVPLLGACVAWWGFAPHAFGFLISLGLVLLVWRLKNLQRAREGAWLAGLAGWGYFLSGISWLHYSLHDVARMPWVLTGAAIALLSAYMALYPALAGLLFVRLRHHSLVGRAAVFAAAWTLSELLRAWVFTGFPWLNIAYSQIEVLRGYFPLVGAYGVGFLLAFAAAILALSIQPLKVGLRLALVMLSCCIYIGGMFLPLHWTSPVGEPTSVALVQTNIMQTLKWDPRWLQRWLNENLEWTTQTADAALTVFPEVALPLWVEDLPQGYLEALEAPAKAQGHDVLIGALVQNTELVATHKRAIHNAAISLGAHPGQQYAKNHLVPFGEFSPPFFAWFYRFANIPMSNQTPGGNKQAPLVLGGQKVAVNICYEDAFGAELIHAVPESTVMLNLSNLAWFGNSAAQPQHLQIAQARALEAGRPMLRATNTGMTAYINPQGEVLAQLPSFTPGVLRVNVQGYQGITPYVRYGDHLIMGISVLLLGILSRKNKPTHQ